MHCGGAGARRATALGAAGRTAAGARAGQLAAYAAGVRGVGPFAHAERPSGDMAIAATVHAAAQKPGRHLQGLIPNASAYALELTLTNAGRAVIECYEGMSHTQIR